MSKHDDDLIDEYDEDIAVDELDDDVDDVDDEPAPVRRAKRSRIPAHAPRPQDHRKAKRKRQVRREAEGDDMVEIDFHGRTFSIPADQDDWPITAIQALSRDRHVDAIEDILGPQQWALFLTRHNNRRDFREFLDVVADEFGFGTAGN